MTSDFVSIEATAIRLQVTVRTLRRWQARGLMPERTKRSRRLMYLRRDIEALALKVSDAQLFDGEPK